jgi:hypothetical protein
LRSISRRPPSLDLKKKKPSSHILCVVSPHRTWQFCFETEGDLAAWYAALCDMGLQDTVASEMRLKSQVDMAAVERERAVSASITESEVSADYEVTLGGAGDGDGTNSRSSFADTPTSAVTATTAVEAPVPARAAAASLPVSAPPRASSPTAAADRGSPSPLARSDAGAADDVLRARAGVPSVPRFSDATASSMRGSDVQPSDVSFDGDSDDDDDGGGDEVGGIVDMPLSAFAGAGGDEEVAGCATVDIKTLSGDATERNQQYFQKLLEEKRAKAQALREARARAEMEGAYSKSGRVMPVRGPSKRSKA